MGERLVEIQVRSVDIIAVLRVKTLIPHHGIIETNKNEAAPTWNTRYLVVTALTFMPRETGDEVGIVQPVALKSS